METNMRIGSTIALLLLGGAAQAQQTTWQVTMTELPLLPGGMYASAYAINDTGKIVGVATDSTGAYKNVQWLNGQISIIPDFSTSGLSVPDDLNDAGEIAGHVSVSGFFSYAVWWDSQNNPTALPGLPNGSAAQNYARAINASGQIVGQARESGPNFYGHGAVWFQGALQTDLGVSTYAYGINDLGDVVGLASSHAFLWRNGQFTDLSTWTGGGVTSWAYAINNHGDIVGLNASVASLWRNGSVQALGMPDGLSNYTPVIDINDAGDMIATAATTTGGPLADRGVLWRNGTPIDLGALPGGFRSRARRINAAGDIVGEAQAANLYFHAVKWTVTALPTTYCFGDGTGSACPCGNDGAAGHGCAHSLNPSGARLTGSGMASLANDSVVLSGTDMPDSSALYFQGTTQMSGGFGSAFGDGLRCASGSIVRLGTKSNVGGSSQFPGVGDPSVSARGLVTTAGTRTYQVWYRNAASFCTASTFNLTNGVLLEWTP